MDTSDWWLRNLLWNCPDMNAIGLHWWSVNIGSGNGLVPSSHASINGGTFGMDRIVMPIILQTKLATMICMVFHWNVSYGTPYSTIFLLFLSIVQQYFCCFYPSIHYDQITIFQGYPDSKVHVANIGPTWVLLAPDGPHAGPMNLAIRVALLCIHSVLVSVATPNLIRHAWLPTQEVCLWPISSIWLMMSGSQPLAGILSNNNANIKQWRFFYSFNFLWKLIYQHI